MNLKEKMQKGPVFGMACYSGVTAIIESIAMSGLDFIYLDSEHTITCVNETFEKQIMAAKLHDIAVLARVPQDDPVAIRKVLEWGADGVIIPHCTSAQMAQDCVRAAKFAPMGRRGAESCVRAANYGCGDFNWNAYMEKQNRETMVIVLDEDYEFTQNIDEILEVPGIDAVNFGPVDYANSLCQKIGYTMGEDVKKAFDTLVKKAEPKGIGRLGPAPTCTVEGVKEAIANGYNMVILGNDMMHFNSALKNLMGQVVAPVQNG